MKRRVVIAGGGVTGLSAAYFLSRQVRSAGLDTEILLVEKESLLGGKTRTERVDGMVIESGPDSFIASKPWLKDLCTELGLPVVGTNPKISTTYIYKNGRMESLPVGLQLMIPTQFWPFVKTRLLSPMGKLRAAMEPLIPIKRDEADESIGGFVGRRFGREVLENVAGPLMGGIYGGDWDGVSINATFSMFPKMERDKGSLLLAAQRSKASRPKSPTGFSMFLTVPTGLQTVVEALVQATSDVRYLNGTTLSGLRRTNEGYGVSLSMGEEIEADAVVLALPAYTAASLVEGLVPPVAQELSEIPYNSSVVVALAYQRSDIDHPLDASGFLVPRSENLDITASTWVSSKWTHATPPDKALFRCFLGRSGGKDWTAETDEAILAAAQGALTRTIGIRATPILTRVFRWRRAMPQYRVGHLERVSRIEQLLAAAPGLYLAGAAYRGVGLPDCVREGAQAAERVMRHLS